MQSVSLHAGLMVTPRIRLERLLGEGGMGAVWVAEHLSLGTRVAVKFVAQDLWEKHPEVAARFAREASAAARMQSPHVVRTYDFGSMDDGTPFLVMELLEGESLATRLEREGSLSPASTAPIIEQVAKALDEAHRLGIVHRDVKPGNIFLTVSGRELFAKLLDFGIARDVESSTANATRTGMMLGTAKYMSPEQLMSAKSVDAHADMWALAVTAYESVVGAAPFRGETMPGLIVAIHGRQFEPPSATTRAAVLGPALDGFFGRAFASVPSQRFASVLDLADAFNRVARPGHAAAAELAQERTSYGAPMGMPMAGPATASPGVTAVGAGQVTQLGAPGTQLGAPGTQLGAPASLPLPPRPSGRRARTSSFTAAWTAAAAFGALSLGLIAWLVLRVPDSSELSSEAPRSDAASGPQRSAAAASEGPSPSGTSASAAAGASSTAVRASASAAAPASASATGAPLASDPSCLPAPWDEKVRGWAKRNVPICRSSRAGFYLRAATNQDRQASLTAVRELWKTYLSRYAGAGCPPAEEMVFFDPDGSTGAGILLPTRPERWNELLQNEDPWLLRDSADRSVTDAVCFFLVTDGRTAPGW